MFFVFHEYADFNDDRDVESEPLETSWCVDLVAFTECPWEAEAVMEIYEDAGLFSQAWVELVSPEGMNVLYDWHKSGECYE